MNEPFPTVYMEMNVIFRRNWHLDTGSNAIDFNTIKNCNILCQYETFWKMKRVNIGCGWNQHIFSACSAATDMNSRYVFFRETQTSARKLFTDKSNYKPNH